MDSKGDDKMRTFLVDDGYNGHKVLLQTSPVLDETETSVKLQVAEKGKEYMFRWVYKSALPKD